MTRLSFCLIQRSPQLELDYFLCFLMRYLSVIDIIKLTIAPREANITVFKTSSECKFGNTLKKVPPAVPIRVWLPVVIHAWWQNRFPCGQLAYSRDHTTGNSQIASYSSHHDRQSYWRSQNGSANGSQCQTYISKHFKKFRCWSFYSFYNIHLFLFFSFILPKSGIQIEQSIQHFLFCQKLYKPILLIGQKLFWTSDLNLVRKVWLREQYSLSILAGHYWLDETKSSFCFSRPKPPNAIYACCCTAFL